LSSDGLLARAAIRRLRSGIVPDWAIARLSVAYGSIRHDIVAGLTCVKEGKVASPLFVRGEWGTGKTHFLTYVRTAASAASIASAWVDLNARSAALNYPQRFYPIVAETMRAGGDLGIKAIIAPALRDAARRALLKERRGWHSHWWTIGSLLEATEESGFADVWDHWAWTYLLGADIASSTYTYKRQEAASRFGALAEMMRAVGLGGLVLLFDEAETIDQLWNIRSRVSAYSVLGRLCRMPLIWCIFGVTERFDRRIKNDIEQGVDHLVDDNAQWFLESWAKNRFAVINPPSMDLRSASQLAETVETIYDAAYSAVAKGVAARCVEEWARNPSRNPRRLIRLIVHHLDLARGPSANLADAVA
jgi:hypothetical protein